MASARDPLVIHLPGGRAVPAGATSWRATTSGGPGGQHANKTASRAELTVVIAGLGLEPREVALVYERLASRITGAGELTVGSADTRDQHRNRQIAVRRMEQVLADALRVERARVRTKPSKGARLRARASKQQTSQKKGARRWSWGEDD